MSQFVESPSRAFTAGAAIGRYLRVKLTSGKLAVAVAADRGLGTLERETFADGDVVAVRLRSAPGTLKMVAAGAVAQAAHVYGAAAGQISATANGVLEGVALEAATAAGDVIEVLRLPATNAAAKIADAGGTYTTAEQATINAIIDVLEANGLSLSV